MAKALSPEWTNEAISDLNSIYNHLLEWNSKTSAQKIINEILNAPNGIVLGSNFKLMSTIQILEGLLSGTTKYYITSIQKLLS